LLLCLLGLMLLLAVGGELFAQAAPEIELQCPPGTPIASGSTDTGWGPTYAQGELYYRSLRVLNLGNADLALQGSSKGSITSSPNCTVLIVHYSPPAWQSTLPAGEWQEIHIGMQPDTPGAWSFTYQLNNADNTGGESPYTITFTGTAAAPGTASTLRIVTNPIGHGGSAAWVRQPVVEALDASGARDTSFNGPVTASLIGGAGALGQLTGTTTVNAVNGVATFTDLEGSLTDSLYAVYYMKFESGGLGDCDSFGLMLRNAALNPGGGPGGGGGGGGSGGGGGCQAGSSGLHLSILGVIALPLLLRRRRSRAA
jgi:hypothetical protein